MASAVGKDEDDISTSLKQLASRVDDNEKTTCGGMGDVQNTGLVMDGSGKKSGKKKKNCALFR